MLSSSDSLAVAIGRHASDELRLFKPACAQGLGVPDLVMGANGFGGVVRDSRLGIFQVRCAGFRRD